MHKLTKLFQGTHNAYVSLYLPNVRSRLCMPFCPLVPDSQDPVTSFNHVAKYTIFYRPSYDWVTYDYEGLRMQDIEHYWCYFEIMSDILQGDDCDGPASVPWRMWVA